MLVVPTREHRLDGTQRSASSDYFDDFETVTGLDLALRKFGWGNGFAVVFDNDASGKQILGD